MKSTEQDHFRHIGLLQLTSRRLSARTCAPGSAAATKTRAPTRPPRERGHTLKFSEKIKRFFSPAFIERGAEYYRQGRIHILRRDARSISANVLGADEYLATLALDEKDDLHASCTCHRPTSRQQEPCKHVWAVALQAEKSGYLAALGNIAAPVSRIVVTGTRPAHCNNWKEEAQALAGALRNRRTPKTLNWPPHRTLLYTVIPDRQQAELLLRISARDEDGDKPATVKPLALNFNQLYQLPDEADRNIIAALRGSSAAGVTPYHDPEEMQHTVLLPPDLQLALVPMLCDTGRCLVLTDDHGGAAPLAWDGDGHWDLWLEIHQVNSTPPSYRYAGALKRGTERLILADPRLLIAGTVCIVNGKAAPLSRTATHEWLAFCRNERKHAVPQDQIWDMLATLLELSHVPNMTLPPGFKVTIENNPPRPTLSLKSPRKHSGRNARTIGKLSFNYNNVIVETDDQRVGILIKPQQRFIHRHRDAERLAHEKLHQLGFKPSPRTQKEPGGYHITPAQASEYARLLSEEGWLIELDGQPYRKPTAARIVRRANQTTSATAAQHHA